MSHAVINNRVQHSVIDCLMQCLRATGIVQLSVILQVLSS